MTLKFTALHSFLVLLAVSASPLAQAQNNELLSVTVEQTSMATNPDEASREMTAKAISQAAREQVIDIIGESKYQKNQKLVETKIIKESSKYIPFVSPGQPVQMASGFKMSIDLKISESSLRNLILNAGLLADSESPGSVLSLVMVTNKNTTQSFRWWAPEVNDSKSPEGQLASQLMIQLNSEWNQILSTELSQKGFKFAQAPRSGALKSVDEKAVIDSYQPQMVVRGEIRERESTDGKLGSLAIKLGVYQAKDNRLITDAVRTMSIEKATPALLKAKAKSLFTDIAKELAGDVIVAWQKGLIGSSLINVVVRGPLSPKQLGDFKTEFMRAMRDLKSLKERRFAAGQVTFEGAYAGDPNQLANRIRAAQLPSFQMQLNTAITPPAVSSVALDVRPRR